MTRLRGRGLCAKRLIAAVPHGQWRTSTFLAGLRHDGLVAPMVFNGAINGQTFRAYVEQALAPTLSVGAVVVLDNRASHKVLGVREAIDRLSPVRVIRLWRSDARSPSTSPDPERESGQVRLHSGCLQHAALC
jgi:hypothetical protein